MNREIRIGSRDSVLAVKQAEIVMEAVNVKNPDIAFKLVLIKTTGDKILDKNLNAIGGKGLFVKELEQALANGDIDIAVHSYKDMPYEETTGLPVVALSKRETPFDALVLPKGAVGLDNSKPVGSSSLSPIRSANCSARAASECLPFARRMTADRRSATATRSSSLGAVGAPAIDAASHASSSSLPSPITDPSDPWAAASSSAVAPTPEGCLNMSDHL